MKDEKWPQLEAVVRVLSLKVLFVLHVFSDFWNCRLRSWLCPLPSWHGWAQCETFAELQGFTQRLLKMPAHGNPQGANGAMKFNNASAKGSTSCNILGTCIFEWILCLVNTYWSHLHHYAALSVKLGTRKGWTPQLHSTQLRCVKASSPTSTNWPLMAHNPQWHESIDSKQRVLTSAG